VNDALPRKPQGDDEGERRNVVVVWWYLESQGMMSLRSSSAPPSSSSGPVRANIRTRGSEDPLPSSTTYTHKKGILKIQY